MKKLILSAALLSTISGYAQTKKVLLEDFTGTWCQYCPNGTKGIEDLRVQYPANFLPVSSHNANNDPLEVAETPTIIAGLGGASYPNGAIDRKFISGTKVPIAINATASQWKSAVATQAAAQAIVSVGFANFREMPDGTYKADVKVKFTSAPEAGLPVALQVMILEDSIKAEGTLAQANGPAGNPSPNPATTHYGSNSPLTTTQNNYWHNHNVRQYLGGAWGWTTGIFPTSGPVVDSVYTKEISFTVPTTGTIPGPNGWNKKQIHIYAFVAYNGSDHMSNEKMVLNAEEISLKAFHKVSVDDLTANQVNILNTYPNPAKASDLVKIEYNIANSEVVTMNVYNALGQRVAQPYVSNEVKGGHTIHWRPADNALTPGLYIIEVSSASGKQIQKINIQ